MNTNNLEKTLTVTEQIVHDAWRSFVDTAPSLDTVPAFLSWLGHHQPDVLNLVNEAALVRIAGRLREAGL